MRPRPEHLSTFAGAIRGVAPLGAAIVLAAGAVIASVVAPGAAHRSAAPAEVPAVRIGGAPVDVALTPDHAWVIDRRRLRIRAFSRTNLRPAGDGYRPRLPDGPHAVAVSARGRGVWVAYAHPTDDRGWVVHIPAPGRPASVSPIPVAPLDVSAGRDGRAVVLGRDGSLRRIRGRAVRIVRASGVAAVARDAAGDVWIVEAGPGGGRRVRGPDRRRPVALPDGAADVLAVRAGRLWVVGGCGKRLARADGGTISCTSVPATDVAAAGRRVWAVTRSRRLVALDAAGRVVDRLSLPVSATAMAVDAGGVWIVSERGAISRVSMDD